MGNSPPASAPNAPAPNAPAPNAPVAPNASLSVNSKKNNAKTVVDVPVQNATKGGKRRRRTHKRKSHKRKGRKHH